MKSPSAADLLSSIHKHCLECCGGYRKEVERCRIAGCALHPYRCNEKPEAGPIITGQVTIFELTGEKGDERKHPGAEQAAGHRRKGVPIPDQAKAAL